MTILLQGADDGVARWRQRWRKVELDLQNRGGVRKGKAQAQ